MILGGVWFPKLVATLPNTRRLKGIASVQAANNDDALVVYDMWDYWILPLFPHLSQEFLRRFQTLMIYKRCCHIYVEFVDYLWNEDPLAYPHWLILHGALRVGPTCMGPRQGGQEVQEPFSVLWEGQKTSNT